MPLYGPRRARGRPEQEYYLQLAFNGDEFEAWDEHFHPEGTVVLKFPSDEDLQLGMMAHDEADARERVLACCREHGLSEPRFVTLEPNG